MNSLLLIVSLVIFHVNLAASSKLLALFPYCTKSQVVYYKPLFEILRLRGHHLDIISSKEVYEPPLPSNVSQFVDPELTPLEAEKELHVYRDWATSFFIPSSMFTTGVDIMCRNELAHPKIRDIILKGNTSDYDLVIIGSVYSECLSLIPHVIKAPSVMLSSGQFYPFLNHWVRNYNNPSHVPSALSAYSDTMNLYQRISNFLGVFNMDLDYHWYLYPKLDKMIKANFGERFPPLSEMVRNLDLLITNSDFTYQYPQAKVPAVIDIPAFHCRPPKKLPQNILKFVESSQNGFILFSMGTVIKGNFLPPNFLEVVLNSFSQISELVIMKWDSEIPPEKVPKNVLILKWIPQQDILGHPNIRLFITHCGLGSTVESIYHAVPIIGIPVVADQRYNSILMAKRETGISLHFDKLTSYILVNSIKEIIGNKSYKENVARSSILLKDKPLAPLDLATYWIEYIIRHKGAKHLRTSAIDLHWYEYYMLDVVCVIVSTCVMLLCISIKAFFFIIKIIPSPRPIKLKRN